MQDTRFSQISAELADILRVDAPGSEHILQFLVGLRVAQHGSAKLSPERLMETPLEELYYQSDLFRALRSRGRTSEGYQGCVHSRACGGGLKCLSYAMTGSPFRRDPGCWVKKDPQPGNRPGKRSADPGRETLQEV